MREKVWELDNEIHFKDTFRVFSKDEEGVHVKLMRFCPDSGLL
jgi:hypothetical protein